MVPDASADGFLSVEPGSSPLPINTQAQSGEIVLYTSEMGFFFTGIGADIGNFSFDVSSSEAFRRCSFSSVSHSTASWACRRIPPDVLRSHWPATRFHRRSPSQFQISSPLQRIVGGEEGVSTRQSAGVIETRWDGVFWAVTPPLEKHTITSDLPASSWRKITRSIWPEADGNKMAARRDPVEYKRSVLERPAGPVSIIVSKPGKM